MSRGLTHLAHGLVVRLQQQLPHHQKHVLVGELRAALGLGGRARGQHVAYGREVQVLLVRAVGQRLVRRLSRWVHLRRTNPAGLSSIRNSETSMHACLLNEYSHRWTGLRYRSTRRCTSSMMRLKGKRENPRRCSLRNRFQASESSPARTKPNSICSSCIEQWRDDQSEDRA